MTLLSRAITGLLTSVIALSLAGCGIGGGPSDADASAVREAHEHGGGFVDLQDLADEMVVAGLVTTPNLWLRYFKTADIAQLRP